MNDGISKPPFTVQYASIDAFIAGVMSHGRGTLLAKFDVASAYRIVGIHPSNRPLLGMKWREQYFVDMTLLFGLRLNLLFSLSSLTWWSGSWFTIMA